MAIIAEMTLEEMLRDPIVKLVMRRDGVKPAEVRAVMRRISAKPRPRARSDY